MVWYSSSTTLPTTSVPLSSTHHQKRTGPRFQKKKSRIFLAVVVKVFLFHVRGVGSTGKKNRSGASDTQILRYSPGGCCCCCLLAPFVATPSIMYDLFYLYSTLLLCYPTSDLAQDGPDYMYCTVHIITPVTTQLRNHYSSELSD